MALDVTAVSPVAARASVYVPAGPLIARPLNGAAPLEPVVAVAFDSVAPAGPLAIVAVTRSPLWLTGLPFASCTCTTGCWVNATPLCALLEGWVLSASWLAVPAPSVIPLDVTAVSPVVARLSVYVPGGPLIAKPPKLAAPVVPVVAVAFASVAPAGPDRKSVVNGKRVELAG